MNGKAGISTIASLATLFFIPTANAHGCSCYRISPCEAFAKAKVVFVGRMIGGAEKNTEKRYDGQVVSYEAGEVNFEVEEVFKGEIGKEFNVFVASDKSADCPSLCVIRESAAIRSK